MIMQLTHLLFLQLLLSHFLLVRDDVEDEAGDEDDGDDADRHAHNRPDGRRRRQSIAGFGGRISVTAWFWKLDNFCKN